MAFCTKCGAQISDGAAFCAKCGARVEAPGAAAPSAQVGAPPPPQAATPSSVAASMPAPLPPTPVRAAPVPSQPKKSGNLFLKVIITIFAFITLACVLLIGSCFYIGYRIKKKADQVQQAYKSGDVGKVLSALSQGQSEGAPNLGKILGAFGQGAAQGGSDTGPTIAVESCPAVDSSQSKTFRDAAASASIPLKPGLTLTSVWTNKDLGGRDVEVLDTVQGIDDNTVTIGTVRAEKGGSSGQRILCIADLLKARQYDTGWGPDTPETISGATMFSMSQHVFQDWKAARPAGFEYLWARHLRDGRYRPDPDQKGQLSRVEAQDVPYPTIVNGESKNLAAIHVKGKLAGQDAEAFVLDDPANPITLSWKQPFERFYINYLKITFPVEKGIQKEIAKSGCAAVYGIYFDFNSAIVRPESGPSLKEVAEAIKNNPDWKLKIEGHTDNVGGDAYNLNLSNQRAAAVRQALVAHYQIDPGRVTSQGFGASRPKAPNTTPEGRALNRRVEVCRE